MELLIGVGVLVAFAVLSFLARAAALKWLHPAPRDVGNDARSALAAAERVFGLARADGGRSSYPWKDGDVTYNEQDLRLRLQTAAARVPDPRLTASLTAVCDALRTVFATAAPIVPMVWVEGAPPMPEDQAEVRSRQLQLDAADAGQQGVESARDRLSVLERRARLWFVP